MSTVRLGFHYVSIFAQWALIVLALFLLIGSTAIQDYLAGIAFIILALFLRVRSIGAWAQRTMVLPPMHHRGTEAPWSARDGDTWLDTTNNLQHLMINGRWELR